MKVFVHVFALIDIKKSVIRFKDGTLPTNNSIDITIGEGNLSFTEKRNIEYVLDGGNLDEVREGDDVPLELRLDFVWKYYSGYTAATAAVDLLAGYTAGDASMEYDTYSGSGSIPPGRLFTVTGSTATHKITSSTATVINFTPVLTGTVADDAVITIPASPTPIDFLKKTGPAAAYLSSDGDGCRPDAIDIELDYDPECNGDEETLLFSDFRYTDINPDLRGQSIAVSGSCNVTGPTATRVAQTLGS